MIRQMLFALLGILVSNLSIAQDKKTLFGKESMTGEDVYRKVCVKCHGHGLVGAPKAGDKKSWSPLIAEGYEDLVGSALTGIRMMPPKGGAPELYDIEVARAVNYIVSISGGTFPTPTDSNVKAARLVGERLNAERLKKAALSRSLQ